MVHWLGSALLIVLLSPSAANACELGLDGSVTIIDESGGTVPAGSRRVCENPDDSQRFLGNLRCRMNGKAVNSSVAGWPHDIRFGTKTGAQIGEELKRGLAIEGTRVLANTEKDPKHMEVSALRTFQGLKSKVGILISTVISRAVGPSAPGTMNITIRLNGRALDQFGKHLAGHEQTATLAIKDPACQRQLEHYFSARSPVPAPDCIYNNVIEAEDEMWDTSMPKNAKGHHSPALALGRALKMKLAAGCPKGSGPSPQVAEPAEAGASR